jgi:hypothetical protein
MLYISLGISTTLIIMVLMTAVRTKRAAGTAITAGAFLSLAPCCLMNTTLIILAHAVAVAVAALTWEWCGWRFRYLLLLLLVATIASYGIVGGAGLYEVRRLQNKYPYVSMERRVPAPRAESGAVDYSTRLDMLEDDLERNERSRSNRNRSWALRQLHENTVEQFIRRPRFGAGRMMYELVSEGTLKLGLRDDVDLPQPGARSTAYLSAGYGESLSLPPSGSIDLYYDNIHQSSLLDFLNPAGFGYFRDRAHVAGFQAHQFSEQPKGSESWKLETLDLVGLLLHQQPVVYITDKLPRMDELRDAPIRDLDPFEEQGLAALRQGEDLFARKSPEGFRLLGAIRCARQCVDCHGSRRGDLLGAFSYTFAPVEK